MGSRLHSSHQPSHFLKCESYILDVFPLHEVRNRFLAASERFPPETFCLRQAKWLVGVEGPSGSDWMFSGLWLTPEVVAVGNHTAFPVGLGTMVGPFILGYQNYLSLLALYL